MSDSASGRSLHGRAIRGVAGQTSGILSRTLVLVVMSAVMLPAWGPALYGEWLTIVGVAMFAGTSDVGFLSAAISDMTIAVGRGDRDQARDTYRAVARGLGIGAVVVAVVVLVMAEWVPLADWLGLERIGATGAILVLAAIAFQQLGRMACTLIAAGYAAIGHYGEAYTMLAAIYLIEWIAAAGVALAGRGPLAATFTLLGVRLVALIGMYVLTRRRLPWLTLGRPSHEARVGSRLIRPALAGAAMGWGTAFSMQAMIVLVGVVAGSVAVAAFSSIRSVARIVVQLGSSIGPAIGPEFGRAYGSGNQVLLRTLQRRVTQLGVWSAVAMVAVLFVVGDRVVSLMTRGTVDVKGPVLVILLVAAVLEVAWFCNAAILVNTNRHQRVGLAYAIVSGASVGLAYFLVSSWGIDGAAVSVLVMSAVMLVVVLHYALPTAGDTWGAWARSISDPRELVRAVAALRARVFGRVQPGQSDS